jgi:hypothetical protein
MRTWLLVLMFAATASCNPPDVTTPRIWPSGGSSPGGNGTPVTSGTGGVPPAGAAGTAGVGEGTAGTMISAGTGGAAPPTGGVGSAGSGTGSVGAGSTGGAGGAAAPMFNAGSDPNRNAVMPGTICSRLAVIQCAGEAFCCTNPGRDIPTCEQEMRSSCDQDAMVDDIAADSGTAFDAARAQMVFTELERLASLCDPTIAAYGESVDGLRSLFAGTVAPDGDCRPANPLNKTMAAAALASCTNRETHACVPSLTDWRCSAHVGAGGHCFSDFNCQAGLFCDNPNFSVSGSDCAQRKAVGASCGLDNECQSLFCRGGSCVAADVQTAFCPAP